MRREKFEKTGILEFDYLLGGLPSGSLIVLRGSPDSGFNVFAQQVMLFRAKDGNKVVYFTVDKPVDDVRSEMLSYNWDTTELEREGKWIFVDAYSHRRDTKRKYRSDIMPLDFLANRLIEELGEAQGSSSVIDTLSYYLLFYDLKDVLEVLEDIRTFVREAGGIHFLLVVGGLHDKKTTSALAHFTDGFLDFKLNLEDPESPGLLRIRKLRGVPAGIKPLSYRIGRGEGITIETSIRII